MQNSELFEDFSTKKKENEARFTIRKLLYDYLNRRYGIGKSTVYGVSEYFVCGNVIYYVFVIRS